MSITIVDSIHDSNDPNDERHYMLSTRPPTNAFITELHYLLLSKDYYVINLMKQYGYYYNKIPIFTLSDVYNYAANGNTNMLEIALNYDNNTANWYNYKDLHKSTAIHRASSNGHVDAVRMLLDSRPGLDLDITNDYDETPLMSAMGYNGHLEVIRLLLDRGADVNILTLRNGSALHHAVRKGLFDIVKLLIERGADINAPLDYYGTALEMATFYNHVDVVALLLNKGATIVVGDLLARAVRRGSEASVKMLLEKGSDIDVNIPYMGQTALMLATDSALVKLLLDRDADVNYADEYDDTPLIYAITEGYTNIAVMLINAGADINSGRCTNLGQAAYHGYPEIVTILLDMGADIYNVDLYKPNETNTQTIDCRSMIRDELDNREKRTLFDLFINNHIEYAPFIEAIYSTCYPYPQYPPDTDTDTDTATDTAKDMYLHETQCRLTRSKPVVGWTRAIAIRDMYYYDEVFFYLHMHVAKVVTRSSSPSFSEIAVVANSSNDVSTLMTILSDRLMMYLKPPALT